MSCIPRGSIAVLALLLATAASSARAEPPTIRLGYGGAADEPAYILAAKPDLGTHVGKSYLLDATRLPSSDKRAQAFEAGAIDLEATTASSAIAAASQGISLVIIASISRESTRGFSTSFYAKEESAIKSPGDLKGKTIGVNGFSTAGELWTKLALEKVGLKETDASVVVQPFPAMGEALAAGKIDVGEFPQPYATILEKGALKVRKVFDSKYAVPFDEELIVIVGKRPFLEKNADAVRDFLADVRMATRFFIDKPQEARQVLLDSKLVPLPSDVYLTMTDYYRDPDLKVSVEALEQMQDLYVKAGFQAKRANIGEIVDTSYLPK
jgi:ABC-type nitrate/sulfonate/bicarbonate transport system substrate-binding protein